MPDDHRGAYEQQDENPCYRVTIHYFKFFLKHPVYDTVFYPENLQVL
jgi:hypothetical protein